MTLLLHRRDPERRMARFYALALQGDLLDGWAVVREWGRIGRAGRVKTDAYATSEAAELGADRLARCKRRRGYC